MNSQVPAGGPGAIFGVLRHDNPLFITPLARQWSATSDSNATCLRTLPTVCSSGQGIPISDVGSLLDAADHLLQPGAVKPDHHLTAGRNHGHTPRFRELDHFIQGSTVLGHIIFRKFKTLLRKKLFRHLAVGSGGC